jgi:hypothetical protein
MKKTFMKTLKDVITSSNQGRKNQNLETTSTFGSP